MLKSLFLFIFKLIAAFPPIRAIARLPYFSILKKIRNEFKGHPEIEEIYLISDIYSKDFSVGLSDLNMAIIVSPDAHPKLVLNQFRDFIDSRWFLSLNVNTRYVPILTPTEFQAKSLQSYILRNNHKDQVSFKSILAKNQDIAVKLNAQNHYSPASYAYQSLDSLMLDANNSIRRRVILKNIYRSILSLKKIHSSVFVIKETWVKIINIALDYPALAKLFFNKITLLNWQAVLDPPTKGLKLSSTRKHILHAEILPQELKTHLKELQNMEFIDDILCTPSIIQKKDDNFRGKVFLEVLVNNLFQKKIYFKYRENLKEGILAFANQEIKIKVKISTVKLVTLQMKNAYYTFPLEGLYRAKHTTSFYEYNIDMPKEKLQESATLFFIHQFMRFRSYKQKSSLIGSKFIKSLNLMYRYHLVLDYLEEGRFDVSTHENRIREALTPQFSEINWADPVTEKDWLIIKAQLIYLLKQIKTELSNSNSELKDLQF